MTESQLHLLRQQVDCFKHLIRGILPDKDIGMNMLEPADWLKERNKIQAETMRMYREKFESSESPAELAQYINEFGDHSTEGLFKAKNDSASVPLKIDEFVI